MEKKLTKEEIDLKIKKSIDKLSKYYAIYNIFSKIRRKVKNTDKFLRKNMWLFLIIYTAILVLLIK